MRTTSGRTWLPRVPHIPDWAQAQGRGGGRGVMISADAITAGPANSCRTRRVKQCCSADSAGKCSLFIARAAPAVIDRAFLWVHPPDTWRRLEFRPVRVGASTVLEGRTMLVRLALVGAPCERERGPHVPVYPSL